jgi:hypothetical protein
MAEWFRSGKRSWGASNRAPQDLSKRPRHVTENKSLPFFGTVEIRYHYERKRFTVKAYLPDETTVSRQQVRAAGGEPDKQSWEVPWNQSDTKTTFRATGQ